MTKGELWQSLLPELELKAREWAELDVFCELPSKATALELLREWNDLDTIDAAPFLSDWLTGHDYCVSEDYEYYSASELIEELEFLALNFLCGFKLGADAAWEVMINES